MIRKFMTRNLLRSGVKSRPGINAVIMEIYHIFAKEKQRAYVTSANMGSHRSP